MIFVDTCVNIKKIVNDKMIELFGSLDTGVESIIKHFLQFNNI